MAETVRVFVSHHHSPEEDAFTAQLVADLEAARADVWVDDERIPADDFIRKINEGLTGRQWLVLVMTPNALRSPWVQAEVNAALLQVRQGRMLGVIPLVAQPCNDADIPPLWATLQRYDATKRYENARGSLFSTLGLMPGQPAPPIQSVPSTYFAPPNRFPTRLAHLGYRVAFLNGAEVILPPLCDVPAGPFIMGSDLAKNRWAESYELPQHWVNLGSYQIAKYPVTVAEYACFMRATEHPVPKSPISELSWAQQATQRLDHPVVNISWNDSMAYATWLAERTGQPWRLPNEAEWERAACWDAAKGVSRTYPWGDAFEAKRCNTQEGKRGGTTPVGSYPSGASPCGAQDMAGNVWEWTSRKYQPYPYNPNDDNDEKDRARSPLTHVLRGGSWRRHDPTAQFRSIQPSDSANDEYGFRLARSVPNS
jgi:formylglycine-generating enzyme required for sulfatase activity